MLWTIVAILAVLWLIGVVSGFVLEGFIHILIAVAVILLLVKLFRGGRRGPAV